MEGQLSEHIEKWPAMVWRHRHRALVFTLLAIAFRCFWNAAEDYHAPYEPGQWRLIGWSVLAIAAAMQWRRRHA